MYNIEELVGKVVSIKTTSNLEVITMLLSIDDELTCLTVGNPRLVIINNDNGEMALIPYALTGNIEEVVININAVVSVMETNQITAEDYEKTVIRDQERLEEKEEIPEDK